MLFRLAKYKNETIMVATSEIPILVRDDVKLTRRGGYEYGIIRRH